MKVKTIVSVATLLMSSSPVFAAVDAQEHKVHKPNPIGDSAQESPAMPGGSMPMMPMHEHMQKMRLQMAEIHRTEDPEKRDELIESHMEDMQGMMKMMHGMREGQPMMGQGGMMGQGMGMPGGKMMGGQQGDEMAAPQGGMMGGQQGCMMGMRTMKMMNRQQMMEKRMDMMQMMMDQMMQNQAAAEETRKMRDDDKSTGR